MSQSSKTRAASAAELTGDPRRLRALCELWRNARQDVWVTLRGGSMVPEIRPGARVRLQCGEYAPVVGEIIAFRQEGRLVIHRLMEVDAQGRLICRGDANPRPDAPVTLDDVAGRVVEVQPARLGTRLREELRQAKRLLRNAYVRLFFQGSPR